MKINELIVEQQVDELNIGKAVGKVAHGIGAVGGGVAGAWSQMKKGYKAGRAAVSGDDDDTAPAAASGGAASAAPAAASGGAASAAPAAASGGAAPAASGGAAASGSSPEVEKILQSVSSLSKDEKDALIAKIQTAPAGSNAAPAAGQAVDIGAKLAQDKAAKAAQSAADAAERDKQIAATKASNAQAAQADSALRAAVKAAKAKPGFQQTASDKLTIQQGAAKGIHESKKKKKKLTVEFKSKFLGMKI